MARDNKQVFRFVQAAFGVNANQMAVVNYAVGATPSTGAALYMSSAGTNGFWYQGFSNTLNRAGFRDTNGDQSILVSGETSAILNDPALVGNTNGAERYCHVTIGGFGPIANTSQWEVLVQGASDSGTGTAGTDWSAISSAIPFTATAGNSTKSVTLSNGIGTLAGHLLQVGDILIPRANGTTGFVAGQPLFVVTLPAANPSGTFGLSKTPGSGIVDTTLTLVAANTYDVVTPRRTLAIPIAPNPKPWARVVVRALPSGNTNAVPQFSGVWMDNVWLTMGRDSASLF